MESISRNNIYILGNKVRTKIWFDNGNEIWSNINAPLKTELASIIFDFDTQLFAYSVGFMLIDYREHIRFKLEDYSL